MGREGCWRHVKVHVVRKHAALEWGVHRRKRREKRTDRRDGARAESLERAAPEGSLAQPPPTLVGVGVGVGVGVRVRVEVGVGVWVKVWVRVYGVSPAQRGPLALGSTRTCEWWSWRQDSA